MDNIKRFLPMEKEPPILDAEGGTGIWSLELARLGYHVVLTNVPQGVLDKAGEKVRELGLGNQIEITVSDICNMREFEDAQLAH